MYDVNLRTADWRCPSVGHRAEKRIENGRDRVVQSDAAKDRSKRVIRRILPRQQNLESIVLGTRILNNGTTFSPSTYCVEKLEDIYAVDFDLLQDPMIKELIREIGKSGRCSGRSAGEDLILLAESPFSVLAALMNPMDLYLCFEEEGEVLREILHRIADASAAYIRACIKAGCRIISLADPVGTINLVGEDYYKAFCGESAVRLMKQCSPYLDQALIHICPHMSRSLLISRLAKAEPLRFLKQESGVLCHERGGQDDGKQSLVDSLSAMAEDPDIHFSGMACIYDSHFHWKKLCRIRLR